MPLLINISTGSFRRFWLAAILITSPAFGALAQSAPITFGKINQADLTAAPFAHDSAAAVVLCDYGQATIVRDDQGKQQMRFDRITRIKILRKAGLGWANVEIPLRHESPGHTEYLSKLEANTYNLVNGQLVITPLRKSDSYLDKVSALRSLQKMTLPQVREGSVIEYRYSILSDYLLNLHSWQFQSSIPVRWSEFRAAMPYRFTYKIFERRTQPLVVDEHSGPQSMQQRFRWAMRDVPAFQPEPYMAAPADYRDELTFELANYYEADITRSWSQIDNYLLTDPNFGEQLNQFGFLKAELSQLPAPTPDNIPVRLAAVRALVLGRVRCSGLARVEASTSLRKTYQETHTGTVADANLLLIMALRAAGFRANPVLISTREHGSVRTGLPQLNQFNYVAAHVLLPDEQDLVLDATDPLLPYDMLPKRCLNQQGRMIATRPDTSRWVDLKPRQRAIHLQQVQLQLTADGSLSGQVHEEHAGYAGASARYKLSDLGTSQYLARLGKQHPDWAITAPAFANRDSVQHPLALDYKFVQAPSGTKALETIYLSPLREFGLLANPLRAETRQYPVDFGYAQEETVQLTLTLPAGYEVTELPKAQTLDLPGNGGRFVCNASAEGNGVQLTSRLSLRKSVYGIAEYGALRELYRRLLEKQAEKLVISKKS